ncbi:MAG: type II toxin-antitoxin system VapC family toxin [Chloroflexi bacterium]|nr:type II toxin-antitoxin system VapC family toxin [Chloroflexota bacterium]MCC6896275.1 type II toxin-antitoxin system VapC family toxin [Anaerolineae bacterium]
MNGKLLDTNAVAALFNQDLALKSQLGDIRLLVSSIVVGELYFGAYKSGRVQHNITQLERFLDRNEVLVCDAETGKYYGQVKQQLKAKGRPIPENDIWIAAVALQHDLALVTRDAHFNVIDNLVIESW